MPNKIYNVKQAAKILGLSTNTTYKYLNEGRIKAARGRIRGTFIITTQALESFLGSKLPESVNEIEKQNPELITTNKDSEAVIEISPPTLGLKVVRILIGITLILIIIDTLTNNTTSPTSQIWRVFIVAIVFLVSYQFGGFVKK